MTPTATTLILTLLACNGGSSGDSATADTGATADDTGTTVGDSGTTDTTPPPAELAVRYSAPTGVQDAGAISLGLVRVSDGAGTLVAGDTLVAADPGTATANFTLPIEAPAEHLVEDTEHAGLMVATYVATAWVDSTADNSFSDGAEPVVGADSDALLVYLTGTVPAGWPTGWSLADNHFADGDAAGDPTFSTLDGGNDVVGLGLLDLSLDLGGSYQASGGTAQGLVGLAVDSGGEPNLDDPVFDSLLSGTTFSVALSGPPDSDFLFYSAEAGGQIAIVGAVIYKDGDGNGRYTWFLELDADAHSMCRMGEPVGLFFLGQSTSLAAVLGLDIAGWQAGWMAFTGNPDAGEELTRLSDADAVGLAIAPTCQID